MKTLFTLTTAFGLLMMPLMATDTKTSEGCKCGGKEKCTKCCGDKCKDCDKDCCKK